MELDASGGNDEIAEEIQEIGNAGRVGGCVGRLQFGADKQPGHPAEIQPTCRGYVILAVLSRYAAFNYSGQIGGTLSNPGGMVDQGLKVVGKSLTLNTYGNAYLDEARKELEGMKAGPAHPSEADWIYWANVIKDSCSGIAAATGATSHCVGGWKPTPPPAGGTH